MSRIKIHIPKAKLPFYPPCEVKCRLQNEVSTGRWKSGRIENEKKVRKLEDKKKFRLCLVTVFIFYFQKLVFGNIKKKQFSCIFEIKNMFSKLKLKKIVF